MQEDQSNNDDASPRRWAVVAWPKQAGNGYLLLPGRYETIEGAMLASDAAAILHRRTMQIVEVAGADEQSGASDQEPRQVVRLQRMVSLRARWLEDADIMETFAQEEEDDSREHHECFERAKTLRECAGALAEIIGAGTEANGESSDLRPVGVRHEEQREPQVRCDEWLGEAPNKSGARARSGAGGAGVGGDSKTQAEGQTHE